MSYDNKIKYQTMIDVLKFLLVPIFVQKYISKLKQLA